MVRNNQLVDKIAGWSLAIIAITRSLAVMHGDSTLGSPAISMMLNIINYACLLCLVPCVITGFSKINHQSSIILALCITLFFIVSTLNSYKGDAEFNIVLFAIMICFCFTNNQSRFKAFQIYRLFLVITALLGIIAFISYILSLNIPYRIVPFYDREFGNYIDYKFAYVATEFLSVRLCGLFNEPGYFGTILALVLIADNINLKKTSNIIMFVAGILTFSLAFFILVIFTFLIKGIRTRKMAIFLVLISAVLLIALPVLIEKVPDVENLVTRFTFEDGEWVGNNRSSNVVDITFEKMYKDGSNSLFGYGSGYTKYLDETGTSSYKGFIIDFGFVGAFIFWGLLFTAAYLQIRRSYNKKTLYLFVICFFMSIYQRPNVFTVNYLLVLFGGLLFLDSSFNKVINIKGNAYERNRHNSSL
jgi:hypothetical protein